MGDKKFEVDISCYCCCPEKILTIDNVKEEFDCAGWPPLQLRQACAGLGTTPLMTKVSTSFLEKSKQQKLAKKGSKTQIRELVSKKRET